MNEARQQIDNLNLEIKDTLDKKDKILLDLQSRKETIKTKDATIRDYNQKIINLESENNQIRLTLDKNEQVVSNLE